MALATGTASAQPSEPSSDSSTEAGSGQEPADNPTTSKAASVVTSTTSPTVRTGDRALESAGSGQEPPDGFSEDDPKALQSRLQRETDSAQQQSDVAASIQDELRTLMDAIYK
jgi:hypothetical protein